MATAAERRANRAALKNSSSKKPDVVTASEPVAEAAPTRSRDTVTVACKVPNGLILQNHILEDGFEPVFGGGSRPIKVSRPSGDPIRITGSARSINRDPDAKRVVGGYGLTFNVPKTAFEQWMRDNKELDMVKNGLIFSHDNPDRAADQARDMKSVKSGLEALNTESKKPDGTYLDPRMPKNVKKYKAEDDSTDIRGVA